MPPRFLRESLSVNKSSSMVQSGDLPTSNSLSSLNFKLNHVELIQATRSALQIKKQPR